MEGGWFDEEAIEQERLDADIEQAQFEEESRRFWDRVKMMKGLYGEGKLPEAASTCPHGGGYPLDSLAANYNDDPNEGENGWRCCDCGSRLSTAPFEGEAKVLVPCEIGPGGMS